MNKTPSPNCNCPEKVLQMAHHLMLECSLLSKDRPPVLKTLPPHLILQYHINTVSITSFLRLSSKHFKTIPKEIKLGSVPSTVQILTYTIRNDGKM
jgi:hypothetical protein